MTKVPKIFLGNLCQYLIIFRMKCGVLALCLNLISCISVYALCLVLFLDTIEKSLAQCLLLPHWGHIYIRTQTSNLSGG